MKCSMLSRQPTVKIQANLSQKTSQATAKMQVIRRKLEEARSPYVRDTFTKLSSIASTDSKFLSEVFTELDTFHKEMFDSVFKKPATDVVVVAADADSNNIFK